MLRSIFGNSEVCAPKEERAEFFILSIVQPVAVQKSVADTWLLRRAEQRTTSCHALFGQLLSSLLVYVAGTQMALEHMYIQGCRRTLTDDVICTAIVMDGGKKSWSLTYVLLLCLEIAIVFLCVSALIAV